MTTSHEPARILDHAAERRTDWRFLLPHPPLHDSGVRYAEWRVNDRAALDRVLDGLAAAGRPHVRVYWPWPTPERARVWLLATPEIVDWYFTSAPRPARHPLRRAQWALRCRAARAAFAAGRLGTIATVAGRDADPLPWWLGAARAVLPAGAARAVLPAGAGPEATGWALVTGGERAENRVLGLVQGGASGPAVAVKLARVAATARRIRHEHDVLRALQPDAGSGLVRTPRALYCADAAEDVCAVESYAAGAQLDSLLRRGELAGPLQQATEWLVALARRTSVREPHRDCVANMERILDRAAAAFAPVVSTSLVDRTRSLLRACGPLPQLCEHRDFAPWNVLVNGDRWTVVDWEVAEPRGYPLLDLLYFSAFLVFSLSGTGYTRRGAATYEALLDAATAEGRLRETAIRQYSDALELPDESVRALRALHWPLHCLSEHDRLTRDHGTVSAAHLTGSFLLPLWDAEVRALARQTAD